MLLNERQLSVQFVRWLDAGEYEKVVREADRYTLRWNRPRYEYGQMLVLAGLAGVRLAAQKAEAAGGHTRETLHLLDTALRRMVEYRDLIKEDPLLLENLGEAALVLERESDALSAYESLALHEPGTGEWEARERLCRQKVSLPLFRHSCADRIEEVWEAFGEHQETLYRQLVQDPASHAAVLRQVEEDLGLLLMHPSVTCTMRNGTACLALRLSGTAGEAWAAAELVRRFPAERFRNWSLETGCTVPAVSYPWGFPRLRLTDVQASFTRDEFGMYSFTLSAPRLLQKKRTGVEFAYSEGACLLVMRAMLEGETGDLFLRRFCAETVTSTRETEGSFPLGRTGAELKKLGSSTPVSPYAFLNTWTACTAEGDPEIMNWRRGKVCGTSCAVPLLQEMYRGKSACVDDLFRHGAAAGSICVPLSSLPGSRSWIAESMLGLVEMMRRNLDPDLWWCTGYAAGETEGYLDLIAWDPVRFFAEARSLLERAGLRDFSFRAMRSRTDPVPGSMWPERDTACPDTGEGRNAAADSPGAGVLPALQQMMEEGKYEAAAAAGEQALRSARAGRGMPPWLRSRIRILCGEAWWRQTSPGLEGKKLLTLDEMALVQKAALHLGAARQDMTPEQLVTLQRAAEAAGDDNLAAEALHLRMLVPDSDPGLGAQMRVIGQRLALPRFERPFRRRIGETWRMFQTAEGKIRAILTEGRNSQEAAELAARVLRAAFFDPKFTLGRSGDRFVLRLLPEGSDAQAHLMAEFAMRMPENLRSRWTVAVGRSSARPSAPLPGGGVLTSADVQVRWEAEDGRLHLQLLPVPCTGEDGSGFRTDVRSVERACESLLTCILGELWCLRRRPDWKAVPVLEEGGNRCTLSELRTSLARSGISLSMTLTQFRTEEVRYQAEPSADMKWRQKPALCTTLCPGLLEELFSGSTRSAGLLHSEGAVPLTFCIKGRMRPEGQDPAFWARSLLELISLLCGDIYWTSLGFSWDGTDLYLDFLAWDLQEFLSRCCEGMKASVLRRVTVRVMRSDAPPVPLYRWDSWELQAKQAFPYGPQS